MGELERNDTDEILFRIFHKKSEKVRRRLDEVMREWFGNYWGKIPGSMPTGRWARILKDAFIAVYRLNLEQSYFFLRDYYAGDKSWLRSITMNPSRDPEGELLRILALAQKDQFLLPLWMRLCRMEEDLPIDYASIGLMGLRKLPEKDGSPPMDLPAAFFKGAICLAEVLGEHNKKEFWLREMRAVVAHYPRAGKYWARYFYPFLYGRNIDLLAGWLDKVIPKLSTHFNAKAGANAYIQPPLKEKRTHFIDLIKKQPLETFRSDLEIFLEDHRRYAYQTGDSSFLVKTFSNIGYKVLRQDSTLALELMQEAFTWEPYNPFLWSQLAIIEIFRGNETRAAALLWEAIRLFPEDAKVRNNLAHLLAKQGKLNVAETIYRQAMEDFPEDDVCRNGLAEVLLAQNRIPEAEQLYRQTIKDFPRDAVCRNGLAVVLLKENKKEEAIALLKETVEMFPGNKVATELLEKITDGKEISETDELMPGNQKPYIESFHDEEFDFPAPLQTTEFHDLPGTEHVTVMEKAFERSGASLVRSNEPIKYGMQPSPAPTRSEPGSLAPELGEIIVELRRSRYVQAEEKENYYLQVSTALDSVLEKAPGNLPALLAKGLWLTDRNPDDAQPFLSKLAQAHPNIIGFRLLKLRTQGMTEQPVAQSKWNDLIDDFPNRSTVIKLEQALSSLHHTNGKDHGAMETLENLRLRFSKDPKHLPPTLQKNEEWVRSAVQLRLFKDINTRDPLPSKALETFKENYEKNKLILRDTIDQCLYATI